MTFRLIEAEKAEHAISRLCSVLGVTRAGYYACGARRSSPHQLADNEFSTLIRRVFVESLETYGAPRIRADLREAHGVRVGRKRVARLIRQLGLEGVSRRGKRAAPRFRILPLRRRGTWSVAASRPRGRTSFGWPTSPTCRRTRAGSSSPSSSMPSAAA
jgi:hypothetical protein